jgi:lipopolysaccharide transport system ATP-binding protein
VTTVDSSEPLITVADVSKKFCRSLRRSMWYGMVDMAKELTGRNTSHDRLRTEEFWALSAVSFELRRGECLGLIGRNGAGKTTLLRMLNGLIKLDSGRIEMRGRVGALIALGAGFNPVLTGRENIYVNGSVLGLSTREIDAKLDEIIDFAGIPEFIDSPVQSYSSGMQVRLGFAVATALEPDVLLVDEVLAVGDFEFRTRCYDRLERMRDRVAIILVSHNRPDIARMCSSVLLLEGGRPTYAGPVADGFVAYERSSVAGAGFVRAHRGFRLLYANLDREVIQWGGSLSIRIGIEAEAVSDGLTCRISIMDASEQAFAEWRSEHHGPPLRVQAGENHFTFPVEEIRLRPGTYLCNFIVSKPGLAQYLILAFRHQELIIRGNEGGACAYQL